ncbi:helix-turn-helix transcriptional regulator [Rossellomorea vietnamensis]|uniref:Helix-turn-helix transcriptional regulator n=1 Tax=Rossellomorea vietnamensis TaxID=218284 RepID=A0A5D4NY20_9BACI|nr:helix-turn-helix transcriptional regulator [Rossellomorea vietnamensis]TYS18681.1 helix-turn-helix transcriptional regulator [Rossellomorea vietnamensis]
MTIGSKIRYHRMKKNLTQEELATGILSVSYLSKIENNQTTASTEVIELLCSRLGISLIQNDDETLKKTFSEWNRALLKNDCKEAIRLYEVVSPQIIDIDDVTLLNSYHILMIRYYILLKDYESPRDSIRAIEKGYKNLSDKLRFYFHKFVGNLHYARGSYEESNQHLKDAEHYFVLGSILDTEEKADLFYLKALTFVQLRKHALAIHYSEEALSLYQSLYHNKRCSEIHLLLGVCYRRIQNISEAIIHYEWANEISKNIEYVVMRGKVEQNLGYLKSMENRTEEAIAHYLKSLEFKHDDHDSKLTTILALVKDYFKLKRMDEAASWLQEGIFLSKQQKNTEKYYEFRIYGYAVEKLDEEFECFMKDEALPYFENTGNPHLLAQYSKFLGNYYQEIRKYKYAAHYLTKANVAYEKIIGL